MARRVAWQPKGSRGLKLASRAAWCGVGCGDFGDATEHRFCAFVVVSVSACSFHIPKPH